MSVNLSVSVWLPLFIVPNKSASSGRYNTLKWNLEKTQKISLIPMLRRNLFAGLLGCSLDNLENVNCILLQFLD